MSKMLSTLNLFCLTQCPKLDAFMKDVLNVMPVLLKQNAPEMDAFQQRLFNSQRETYFLLKLDAPQNQCLSCQRCCQHWTFFVWHNAPKMDAFMKDVLNVKPVLLRQNAPEMAAFQQRLFNSQRETYFLLRPDAPKSNAFHVKDVVNIEPFLFDTMPPKWMPFSKDFLFLSVKPIFCWNLMPPKPMPFMSKMLSTLNLFCLTQCPQNGCLYERCSQCEASSFKAKCPRNGCLSWQLFLMRNLFLFHMMLPIMDAFSVNILSTLNPFCLTYCPWNRWWQMFSMSTPCFVRPSFGKDALNFENPFDRDILHAKCSSALWNKGPPEWARALFSGMKNKLSDAYSKLFSGLLTFSVGSGCISRPCKIIPKCSLSLEIWNLFWTIF